MTIKIGIPAQESDGRFGVNANYLEFICTIGNPVIIFPETYDDFREIYKIDGILLPGGADVDYRRYTRVPKLGFQNPNPFLEFFDHSILPNFVGKIPIFGICRGLQTLNVLFGGTLRNLHRHPYSNYETDMVHKVVISGVNKELEVNSFHHQGIKNLGKNLTADAISDDGVIEAISNNEARIFAVQWHPERFFDEYSSNKFAKLFK